MRFRIGINLGDVIVEGDDIYGNGVNEAARPPTPDASMLWARTNPRGDVTLTA